MSLSELTRKKMEIQDSIEEIKRSHTEELNAIQQRLRKVEFEIGLESGGLDAAKVELAESAIYARGEFGFGDDRKTVEEAIEDIAHGCKTLSVEYLGTKNYAHWHHQGTQHSYGYGPKHGSVVFAIGKVNPKQEMTVEEQDAAIYYLTNLDKVYSARMAAMGVKA